MSEKSQNLQTQSGGGAERGPTPTGKRPVFGYSTDFSRGPSPSVSVRLLVGSESTDGILKRCSGQRRRMGASEQSAKRHKSLQRHTVFKPFSCERT